MRPPRAFNQRSTEPRRLVGSPGWVDALPAPRQTRLNSVLSCKPVDGSPAYAVDVKAIATQPTIGSHLILAPRTLEQT